MDTETLHNLQTVEFEILVFLDDFCRKHNINYSLYAGTALGAVRHKGFIPWDDDVDIAMTRIEFDRFCKIWMTQPVEGYYLESIMTDDNCSICHAKLRKDGTVFLSNGESQKGHHGIWVDIFPLDKVSLDEKKRTKKYRIGREIILISRANTVNSNDSIKKRLTRDIMRLIPHSTRMSVLKNLHTWLVNHFEDGVEAGFEWKSMSTMENIKKLSFPPDLDSGYTTIEFNKRFFSVFKNYDVMLKSTYGDYMKLPPESERICKHNPVMIQF